MSLFRPPIVRSASAVLNRSLFSKTVPLPAARVMNPKDISRFLIQLDKTRELAKIERIPNIQSDPDPALAEKGGKCMLLKSEIKHEGGNQRKIVR
jgi:tRNA (guanine37-N1)-methyltransferase